jgi:hypothetical protein
MSTSEDTTAKLREVAIDNAFYNIAHGLQRMISYANEPGQQLAREGAEMLRAGLNEAFEPLTRGRP